MISAYNSWKAKKTFPSNNDIAHIQIHIPSFDNALISFPGKGKIQNSQHNSQFISIITNDNRSQYNIEEGKGKEKKRKEEYCKVSSTGWPLSTLRGKLMQSPPYFHNKNKYS